MPYTALQIAELIGGAVIGDAQVALSGFAPAGSAKPGDLTFAENEVYFERAEQSAASAILVDGDFRSRNKALIQVPNARIGFAKAMAIFFPDQKYEPGIHPSSVVEPSASIDPSAHIGPLCYVGKNVRIGVGVVLQGQDYIGDECDIGDECCFLPNVTLYPRTQLGRRVRIHAGSVI